MREAFCTEGFLVVGWRVGGRRGQAAESTRVQARGWSACHRGVSIVR